MITACQETPPPTAAPAATAVVAVDDAAPAPAADADAAAATDETADETAGDAAADTTEPVAAAPAGSLPLVDDFDAFGAGLPSAQAGAVTLGFLTWSDGTPVNVAALTVAAGDALARPEQAADNVVLQLDTAVALAGWAGFTHAFADPGLSEWTPQDWSAYEGLSLWLYGNNTGGVIFIDILENRNPDSRADDAERWSVDIPDDFSGWQYFEIPFADFARKDIGNGAPFDGFALTAVHGYAIGTYGSVPMGPQAVYIDDVQLYGVAPPRKIEATFYESNYIVVETGRAEIRVILSEPPETEVSVDYGVAFGFADSSDYEPVNGTLTFAPGERVATFFFYPVDDDLDEPNESLMLALGNPNGIDLGFASRTTVIIRDNDDPDPGLLLGFDALEPLWLSDSAAFAALTVPAGDALALPDQAGPVTLAQVTPGAAAVSVGRHFLAAQDWGGAAGISFWFYGSGGGATYTVQLLEDPLLVPTETVTETWELVWSDEFNGPAGSLPNPGIWRPEQGDGTLNGIPGWGNNERETYTGDPENVSLDGNGNLVITAREADPDNAFLSCYYGPCEYTSARLITWHTFEQTYGRIEARLQIPAGQGLWPAFWMLGNDLAEVDWPQSGEIDIMENIGREPDTIHGTVHGPGYFGGNGIGGSYTLPEGAFADDFHVFAVEWVPGRIDWYVDGILYHSVTPADIPQDEDSEWVYDHPFFIIMNVAVGGSWPGQPDESSVFPQTMTVDYVRVYGAPSTAERYEATFVDDVAGWRLVELPFSAFAAAAEQPAGVTADGLNLAQIAGFDLWLPAGGEAVYVDEFRLIE